MCPSPAGQHRNVAAACSPSAPQKYSGPRSITCHAANPSRSSSVNGHRLAAHATSRGDRDTHSSVSNRNRLNLFLSAKVNSVTDSCSTHRQPGGNRAATPANSPQNIRGGVNAQYATISPHPPAISRAHVVSTPSRTATSIFFFRKVQASPGAVL